jgi:hypothetical protein
VHFAIAAENQLSTERRPKKTAFFGGHIGDYIFSSKHASNERKNTDLPVSYRCEIMHVMP